MAPRLQLHNILETLSENVYFQPPNNVTLIYPCIVYSRSGSQLEHADDMLYRHTKRYQVTVIDRNPDSDIPDQVVALPLCSFDRWFASDNLNHWVLNLFY
jgi:hypothetical protein